MLKLLICITAAFVLAITMLQIRQQRLELNFQVNRLHNEIKDQQAKLWSQQLQVAVYTAPNAISKTVSDKSLKMVPERPNTTIRANWYDGPDGTATDRE